MFYDERSITAILRTKWDLNPTLCENDSLDTAMMHKMNMGWYELAHDRHCQTDLAPHLERPSESQRLCTPARDLRLDGVTPNDHLYEVSVLTTLVQAPWRWVLMPHPFLSITQSHPRGT